MEQLALFVLIIHVLAAVCIVALVLVQQGKGATVGASFGSGASQTIFGSRGSGSFLLKVTLGLGLVFFITSIVLNRLAVKAVHTKTEIVLPAKLPVHTVKPEAPKTTPHDIPQRIPGGNAANSTNQRN